MKELKRKQWRICVRFSPQEYCACNDTSGRSSPCNRIGPAKPWRFNHAKDEQAETQRNQQCAGNIKLALGAFTATFRNKQPGDYDYGNSDGKIDEENPSPRKVLDEPSAKDGPNGGGNSGEA